MVLTDEDIKRLYQDPKFLGSFSGAVNLRQFLFTDYGEVRQMLQLNLNNNHSCICLFVYSTCPFQEFIGF